MRLAYRDHGLQDVTTALCALALGIDTCARDWQSGSSDLELFRAAGAAATLVRGAVTRMVDATPGYHPLDSILMSVLGWMPESELRSLDDLRSFHNQIAYLTGKGA